MSHSRSATVAAGAPLGAAEERANFPRYRTTPRERGEAEIERIAISLNLEGIKIVVCKINEVSRLRRARGPPMGRPNRQYEGSRFTAQQRNFLEEKLLVLLTCQSPISMVQIGGD